MKQIVFILRYHAHLWVVSVTHGWNNLPNTIATSFCAAVARETSAAWSLQNQPHQGGGHDHELLEPPLPQEQSLLQHQAQHQQRQEHQQRLATDKRTCCTKKHNNTAALNTWSTMGFQLMGILRNSLHWIATYIDCLIDIDWSIDSLIEWFMYLIAFD